ncbi:hypothetical protein SteCoe_29693 [Stentor coeruleus]|uniref:Bromo domain-containing protein n=1 Tax=Stentor coeruleus TaxID=5963 RepID=A0A1R2B5D0_9CILI|nr:hypothetical protein SteCoe_29693 [Stentor coeruleus]
MSEGGLGLNRDEIIRAMKLIKNIERHGDSYEFRHPVDYIELDIPDYPDIIKHPMDLSTLKKNLKEGKYQTLQDFIYDVQLIWDNCKLYNPEESYIYKQAVQLQERANSYCEVYNIPLPIAKEPDIEPIISSQEKNSLSELVKKVSINALAHIVLIVEKNCPEAFSQLEKNKVLISLEKISYSTFNQIKEIIQSDLQ